MLPIPRPLSFLYDAAQIRNTLNQKLSDQNLPPIGPAYRICPAPRTTFSWSGVTVTFYLQYLETGREIQLIVPVTSATNPASIRINQTAGNPHCL